MVGYLVCEDGPSVGLIIPLETGEEWIIGRDPAHCQIVLEDPMVSRKHASIHLIDNTFTLENLSEVNPIKINGELGLRFDLHEDDTIQIGNNYFRFSETSPEESASKQEPIAEVPTLLPFTIGSPSRFFLKVLSGPNQGAEFGMSKEHTYVLGKDASADIVFQDLSVSHRHAKLSISPSGEALIEDLSSRNGIIINGLKIEEPTILPPGGVVSIGTTVFLYVDKEASEQTIYSPSPRFYESTEEDQSIQTENQETSLSPKNWKETFIPTKHLVFGGTFSALIVIGLISLISLFNSQSIAPLAVNTTAEINKALLHFPNVQYSYNSATGKIFLIGHVLTEVEYAEMNYLLKSLPFINSMEDTVIVDEGVWQERGYLQSEADAIPLQDYINLNFPYLNLLDNQVIVENTLQTQVENLLIASGFTSVELQMGNGEVILSGKVNEKKKNQFGDVVTQLQEIPGIRVVKNFVVFASETTSLVDLTSKYTVMGSSKLGNMSQYILIGGKILAVGDALDGMTITAISSNEIMLDKEGIKYKIDYNQH